MDLLDRYYHVVPWHLWHLNRQVLLQDQSHLLLHLDYQLGLWHQLNLSRLVFLLRLDYQDLLERLGYLLGLSLLLHHPVILVNQLDLMHL